MNRKLIHIIKNDKFVTKLTQIASTKEQFIDLESGIDWALERDPEWFDKIDNNYYIWLTDKISDEIMPQLRISFHYNKETSIITLIDVEKI